MNLRRKKPHDSLYLLLDTLCNAFGGIILLAVLVVLLTSKEKSNASASADTEEMYQRRIQLAQTNLQQSLQLAASLQAKANEPTWKEQMALLSIRKDLQDAIRGVGDSLSTGAKELETAEASDPAERLKFLNAELSSAQIKKLDAQNGLAAANTNIVRLNQRLTDMRRQITNQLDDLQHALRLPREHDTEKRVIYLIAQYGRIYPCRYADMSRNETDIHWTTKSGGDVAEPISSKGFDPKSNPHALDSYFNSESKNDILLAFCVYEDSFPAFLRAKQLVVANGMAYGWEPFQNADGRVIFGANGHRPKAQ